MKLTRHIGKLKSTGSRVVVILMQLPGDKGSCLVTEVDSLPPKYQDALSSLIMSKEAQNSIELHDVLNRTIFPTGGLMLPVLHQEGLISKKSIREIVMTPTNTQSINLVDVLTATGRYDPSVEVEDQKRKADDLTKRLVGEMDLATEYTKTAESAASPADTARSMMAQSKLLADDAKRLKDEAYALDPSLKPKTRKAPAAKKATTKTA